MELYGYEIQREKDLSHHGILGMKWGKRNGPPYPLDANDHSASENKAGWRKSLSGENNKSAKLRQLSQDARENADDLKLNGANSETFRKAYVYADKMSDFGFYLTYGSTKNQAVKDLIKFNEKKVIKYDKKADRIDGKNIQKILACSPEEAQKIRQVSKIIGISLATTAGILAAGYLLQNRETIAQIIKDPNGYFQILEGGYNKDAYHLLKPISLGELLFSNRTNGNYIGSEASKFGYRQISGSALKDFIANHTSNGSINFDELVDNVRFNFISSDASRRLSCWSASNAFYLSSMTGGNFISKSFENLVDFNDFGKLFSEMPKIFTFSGAKASNFVGKFGTLEARANSDTAKRLITSIFENVSSANNLAVDGKTTVGFINAAYHSTTCTHQWNFELKEIGDGIKELFISDGYYGTRYNVGKIMNGSVSFSDFGMNKFITELSHFNESSIRFYAPSLKSLNLDMLSNVILGKI